MRYTVAHDISALMEYKGYDVERAAREVVEKKLFEAGGSGGVVCLDHHGRAAMVTNVPGIRKLRRRQSGCHLQRIIVLKNYFIL